MNRASSLLDNVKVASPCSMSWHKMQGNDRVRFCGQCKLNVYHLSGMKRCEAESLLREHEGRLCVRYFQRADGTVMTKDCPVGLRLARKAAVRTVGMVAAVCVLLFNLAATLGIGSHARHASLSNAEPFRSLNRWLSPAPVFPVVMGVRAIVLPTTTPKKSN